MSGAPGAAGEGLETLTPDQKRALLARLLQQKERRSERTFPMSFSQQRLWFLDQLSPGNPFYNVEAAVPLNARIDVDALERAINEIVRRHDVLRTTFRMVEGQPVQVVQPELPVELPVVDLRRLRPPERAAEVNRLRVEEATRSFDLAAGPLLRTRLLWLEDSRYLFLLGMHHIVSDGWSMGVFGREMQELYAAFVLGRTSPLPELPIQYGDFAVWQQKYLAGPALQEQLGYWRGQLDGLVPLELPTDRARPPVQTFRGAVHNIDLPDRLARAVKRLSSEEGVTLFMTLLTAFKVLLCRYSGQEDVVVGTYIANRNRAEIEPLIGFFLNTLVLRTRLEGELTVRQALRRVREVSLGAYAHQDLPFEKLVEELHPERDLSRNPLFQVTFQVTNAPTQQLIDDPEAALDSRRGASIFDLAFMLFETTRGISGQFEYSTELFEASTIARMAEHFRILLEGMVAAPEASIARLPLLTAAEEERLLREWNATAVARESTLGLVAMLEARVARSPDRVAVRGGGREMTFATLDEEANRLAHHLLDAGVKPGSVVGLCMERSPEMVAAFLGILKAGGVYLPLDPGYPPRRLDHMLRDARADVLITDGGAPAVLAASAPRTIDLRSERALIAARPSRPPAIYAEELDAAYIVYTSGSTGRPKGVVASHRQILNRLEWMWREYPFADGEVSCQKTALSFVDSLWELLGPLLRGVPSVILSDEEVRDPQALVAALAAHRVTRLWLVPSLLAALLDRFADLGARLPDLKFWVSSGEALTVELLQRFQRAFPEAVLYNLYGTSEVWDVTWYDPSGADGESRRVPIGRPIDNVRVYPLDRHGQPVPIGVAGELYVAGAGVAEGYFGNADLTRERFVTIRPGLEIEEVAYRTGDRVRYLPDGNLEHLGRLDQQLKVRGSRVEPEEIEAALADHPAVRRAAVAADAEDRLIACLVPASGAGPAVEELRRFLAERLPPYMLPQRFIFVEDLPLTPSGKVDRRAIGERWAEPAPLEESYVPPRPGVEEEIAGIWRRVLGVERVGAHDNFFDHGGHSLLATQVMSRLNAGFEVEIPLRQLFESPTVAGMALVVEQARGSDRPGRPAIPRLSREAYRQPVPDSPAPAARPAR